LSFSKFGLTGKTHHKEQIMATKITMQDLISVLRKASSNPQAHAKAQRSYFSELKEDSVLVNCGSACCVAGDLVLKAHQGASEEELNAIISQRGGQINPAEWVVNELRLTEVEATLAFDVDTHHEVHSLLADLLEQGLRLPDDKGLVELSYNSTYTEFDCAYVGVYQDVMDLDELLSWMRKIAQ
jgi:hypothetical protein